MRLYIIRHGQSTNNALADQRDRVSDPPLTELGKLQAETLARHLMTGTEPEPPDNAGSSHHQGGYGITRLYCSPMWRALQTSEPIGQALDLAPQVWADLHERGGIFLDHGDGRGPIGYPGKTREEIRSAFPDYSLGEGITDHGWWNRAYEDWPECHERAARVAEALHNWADSNDAQIAIVSHVDFIDALLKSLFKQLPDDGSLYYYLYNAAISRIDFHSNGCLDICYLNQVGHLPPALISGNPRRPFACPTP